MLITKLKKQLPLFLLLFLLIALVVANYQPGTWLTGWDNLHPEFNFAINVKRALFSVWQEYQGLGLLSGMAHAADLFRILFLWLASLIIPDQFSRYFYHFLMLAIGSLGTYFFIKNIALNQETKNKRLLALLGGAFYLLNFGTVQYFFTPFEPFSTFWGFFPWELYVLFQYLFKPSRRNILILAIVNLLATAQAYVQPLFVVYGLIVGLVGLGFLKNHRSFKSLRVVMFSGVTILLVNAFWLLPNAYFVLTKVHVTQAAMNNQMNTERFFQWSKSHGTLTDLALLRNIPYDQTATTDQDTDYMLPWRDYFTLPLVETVSIGFFVLGFLGLCFSRRWRSYLLLPWLLIVTSLLSQTPLVDLANELLRKMPLASQIFRNPFTKMIVPLIFFISVGLALNLEIILSKWKKLKFSQELLLVIFAMIIYISLPSFSGNLFSGKVRQNIPHEYFALFRYLKQQPSQARIMNLPQDSYWGWGSYRWGSLGSGFLWYGVEQPIMDRAFDVWSKELEGYYWELVYALKTKNQALFDKVIEKYDIAYILYDRNYIPSDQINLLNLYKQQDLLTNSARYSLIWQQKSLFLYRVNFASGWVRVKENLPTVNNESFMHFDRGYIERGDYIKTESAAYVYPFNSLFSNRFVNETGFSVFEAKGHLLLQSRLSGVKQASLLQIKKPKKMTNLVTDLPFFQQSYYLNHKFGVSGQTYQTATAAGLRTYAKSKSLDIWWSVPEASPSGYILKITSRTLSGFPLTLTVATVKDQHKYLLTLLHRGKQYLTQYFVLPQFEEFDQGLEIRLNNHSFNQNASVSEIKEIYLIPFAGPQVKMNAKLTVNTQNSGEIIYQQKNYWFYQTELAAKTKQTLILSQAYDKGWHAYLNGRELKNHVLVNNWANGWQVPEGECTRGNCEVKIVFFPQYLQFIGFGLLFATLGWVVFLYKDKETAKKSA